MNRGAKSRRFRAPRAQPQSGRPPPSTRPALIAGRRDRPGRRAGTPPPARRRLRPARASARARQRARRRRRCRPGHARRRPPRSPRRRVRLQAPAGASAGASACTSSHTGVVLAVSGQFRRRGDRRAFESSTMRTGESCSEPGQPAGQLRIVGQRPCRLPTRIASCVPRRRWPSARAASPVIQWLSPRRGGDAAVERGRQLQVNSGRLSRTRSRKPALISAASLRARTDLDLDAGRAQPGVPLRRSPADRDPRVADTTRATPASIRASAQGGVRP